MYVGLYENETAHDCQWMVPATHYLESWGDARAYDGSLSIVQPLIAPLYDGRTTSEVLAALTGNGNVPATAHDLLRASWTRRGVTEDDWHDTLGKGIAVNTAFARAAAPSIVASPQTAVTRRISERELNSVENFVEVDGCFSDNAWLQELPDPITTLTWGNAAQLGATTAARVGVVSGDRIALRAAGRSLVIPALIVPGHADGVVSLHFGYGRSAGQGVADGVGVNAYPLWNNDSAGAPFADMRRVDGRDELALTQLHWSLEPHTPARAMRVNELPSAPQHTARRALTLYEGDPALPDRPAANQWAMTIDRSTCIGCGACAVACQAENNVPVVGVDGVRRHREMHWLRIDRYASASPDATGSPEVIAQPMLCQHCEKAPCEYVCPVEATVHSPDGLNEMVYNRCVGTRFCSNNCPYKVRRFNWFDYNAELAETEKLAKNPDVSVRERGVMEKCTFCVQRIREAEIGASVEGRALHTDEVRTACQQACPTHAIVFGSLTDPDSAVQRGRDGVRAYAALGELGTEPRVRYLARVRNPNPELDERPSARVPAP